MAAAPTLTIKYQVLVVAAGLAFLAGLLINVFIVAVNIYEWKKKRQVSMADKVITSLGISRAFFQGVCLLYIISDIYFHRSNVLFLMSVKFLEVTSIYSSIWLSTLLSVVYFLKVSTLHNAFFLRLKILVLNRVLHLIVASVVVPFSFSLVCSLMATVEISYNSSQEMYKNAAFGLWASMLIFLTTGPSLIYLISSVLLIICLYHHMDQIRSERNVRSHLDAYYRTIKFTGFSFFCSTCYIVVANTFEYFYFAFGLLGLYFFWQTFPTLHSMYLIYGTVKLRVQASNMIRLLRRRCCDTKAPVETVCQ